MRCEFEAWNDVEDNCKEYIENLRIEDFERRLLGLELWLYGERVAEDRGGDQNAKRARLETKNGESPALGG